MVPSAVIIPGQSQNFLLCKLGVPVPGMQLLHLFKLVTKHMGKLLVGLNHLAVLVTHYNAIAGLLD